MKNFNDTIGNRTGDLPACSVVPQPTALPGATNLKICKKETNARYCIDTLENVYRYLKWRKGKCITVMTQVGDSVDEVLGTDGRGF